jgi:hypothetical protein
MSPEQIAGREVDRRTDIFSVGVVLYELIAGHRPFEGESPTAVMMKIVNEPVPPLGDDDDDCPAVLVSILERALSKPREERYQRAGDIVAELDSLKRMLTPRFEDATQFKLTDTTVRGQLPFGRQFGERRTGRRGWSRLADRAQQFVLGNRPRWLALATIAGTVIALVFVWSSRSVDTGTGPRGAPPKVSHPSASRTPPDSTPLPITLRVKSTPKDASIFLDDSDSGFVTPAEIRLDSGRLPKRVRLVKRGYVPQDIPIDAPVLAEGIERSLSRTAEPTTITFSGDYPFELVEGSRLLQAAAPSHELKITERRTIRMRAPEVFLDRAVTVEPGAGRREVSAPRVASLTIRTIPSYENCLVSIANHSQEGLPFVVPAIVEGPQDVRVSCPDGRTLQRRIQIVRGGPAEVLR